MLNSMQSQEKVKRETDNILGHIEKMERDSTDGYLVANDQRRYFKEIETANEERLKELITLLKSIGSVFFKALHHYAKWKLNIDRTSYREAVEAARLFEKGADFALRNGWDRLVTPNLEFALIVNRSLNYKDEIQRLILKAIEYMKVFYKEKKHERNMSLIRLFLNYGDIRNKDKVEEVFSLTSQTLDELYSNRNCRVLKDYTKLALELNKNRQDEETRIRLISNLAEYYVKYSRREISAITRYNALEMALELYREIGAKEEINRIEVEMPLVKKDIPKESTPFVVNILYRQEMIDKFLDIAEKTKDEEIPILVGNCSYFVPRKNEMIKFVRLNSLGGMLMPSMFLGRGNVSDISDDAKDQFIFNLSRHYSRKITQEIGEIRQIIIKLIERNKLSKDNIMIFFSSNTDVITKQSLKFIEDGVERYFKNDFVGSIFILIPQIEAVLRSMMQKLQIPTTVPERKGFGIIEGDLGYYLCNLSVKQRILGEDFAMWLRIFLVEKEGGLNIRNDIAHGLIEFHQLTPGIASGVLFALLRLGCLQIMPRQDASIHE